MEGSYTCQIWRIDEWLGFSTARGSNGVHGLAPSVHKIQYQHWWEGAVLG